MTINAESTLSHTENDRSPVTVAPFYPDEYIAMVSDESRRELELLTDHVESLVSPDFQNHERKKIDPDRLATRLIADTMPTFTNWLETIPSVTALEPLYDPEISELSRGENREIGPELREWFRSGLDAVEIRQRAKVVQECILSHFMDELPVGPAILSLACGAGQPILEIMQRLRNEGIETKQTYVDLSGDALALVERYAERYDQSDLISLVRANILQKNLRDDVSRKLQKKHETMVFPEEGYDVVEAVGFAEYVRRENIGGGGEYSGVFSKDGTTGEVVGLETLIKNMYDLVRPGGRLIVANMLKDRPREKFLLGAVQWPNIEPRSTGEMIDVFRDAGISEGVECIKTNGGAYAVYSLQKDDRQ